MTLSPLAFSFWYLPSGLLWVAVAALNFWVWRRSKSNSHLIMLLGSGWLAQYYVLATFEICLIGAANYGLAVVLGSLLFAIGFYLSVKPLVADDVARLTHGLRSKLGKPGAAPVSTSTPPASPFFASSSSGSFPVAAPVPSASKPTSVAARVATPEALQLR